MRRTAQTSDGQLHIGNFEISGFALVRDPE
jgi:hypothetical protein